MTTNEAFKPVCGFIGLGSQGAPMARRMIEGGYQTLLWARRAASLEPYCDMAVHFAATVEELGAAVDHVGLCVVNDDDVREMASRLLPVMRSGAILAIHSTVHPDTCRAIAARASERNIHVLDAPVSGGSPAAEAGQLTVMVGGDANALARARPVFETFAGLIEHLGAIGAGQHVKLINNSLLAANLGLADAAMAAAETLGINQASFVELIKAGSGRSFALEVRARMESPAGFRHGGALLRKDIRLLSEVLGSAHPAADIFTHAAEGFLSAAAGTAVTGSPARVCEVRPQNANDGG
jgi:3-hydroxyisobutyrate dehydrogenase-like beta-hydroxyacid dehydrogenase